MCKIKRFRLSDNYDMMICCSRSSNEFELSVYVFVLRECLFFVFCFSSVAECRNVLGGSKNKIRQMKLPWNVYNEANYNVCVCVYSVQTVLFIRSY